MTGYGVSFRSSGPTGVVGKALLSLFFLVFFGMGCLFFCLMGRDVAGGMRTWTWRRTDCQIISSSVVQGGGAGGRAGDFHFAVKYAYTVDDRTLTSEKHQYKPEVFEDYGKAARLAQTFQPGTRSVCFVNSSAPAEAVLERPNPLLLLTLLFPLIFVGIGGGGVYFTWRGQSTKAPGARPISDLAGQRTGRGVGIVVLLGFLLMGGAFCYILLIRPAGKILAARQWPAVPCEVVASEVRSESGSEGGTTYRVSILYRYEFNGLALQANRYDFVGGTTSGRAGKQAIVNRHPPGFKTVCFVNPADPTDAVLERGFTPMMWFGLIPLVFVLVGVIGLVAMYRKQPSNTLPESIGGGFSRAGDLPRVRAQRPQAAAGETVVLKPKTPPWARLLGTIAIALFWNGIISVFVVQVFKSWRSGRPEWFLTLFMIPFVLIGLGFLGGIVYFFLALFNPRPRLMVTPGVVPLGGTLRVEWQMTGRTGVLRSLNLRLEGREEATYRRGTSTATDKSVFARFELAKVATQSEMRSGNCTVTVPADLMHSFASKNNKIIWSLQLRGEIARWPDVSEEFPVTVTPLDDRNPRRS